MHLPHEVRIIVVLKNNPRGIPSNQTTVRYAAGKNAPVDDGHVIADFNRPGDYGSRPDPDITPYYRQSLLALGMADTDSDVMR